MATLPFSKLEGLGNDFIVVDLRPGRPAAGALPSPEDPEVARALCDRHFGIGADGVLAVLPGDKGDARMRVINADGSEAEMCGNGIRCVAKFLYESDAGLRKPVIQIDTGAGLLACSIEARNGQVDTVSVEMGRPRLTRAQIPMTGPADERPIRTAIEAAGRSFLFTAASMGNPHAVTFIDDAKADLMALARTYGPGIETNPVFPRRTNVEFARLRQGTAGVEIDLVVWERGCGITLACGTGACATAVAACLEGRALPDKEIPVHLPGGPLYITVRPDSSSDGYAQVTMRGPARRVFDANIDAGEVVAGVSRAARVR